MIFNQPGTLAGGVRKAYVDTRFGQIHYRYLAAGNSDAPVVFFHRTPVTSASFVPVMEGLAGWRPMVAFDTPGFGASFTPEQLKSNLVALIEALNKAKPAGVKGVYMRKVSLSSTMGAGVCARRPGIPPLGVVASCALLSSAASMAWSASRFGSDQTT